MFQAVLIAVIVYLVACYGYGMYLLLRLYRARPTAVQLAAAERQARIDEAARDRPPAEAYRPARAA